MSNNKKNIEQCPTENLPLINPATNVCFALPEQVCTVQISKKKKTCTVQHEEAQYCNVHSQISFH